MDHVGRSAFPNRGQKTRSQPNIRERVFRPTLLACAALNPARVSTLTTSQRDRFSTHALLYYLLIASEFFTLHHTCQPPQPLIVTGSGHGRSLKIRPYCFTLEASSGGSAGMPLTRPPLREPDSPSIHLVRFWLVGFFLPNRTKGELNPMGSPAPLRLGFSPFNPRHGRHLEKLHCIVFRKKYM